MLPRDRCFRHLGYDDVDLVLVPHVAGVVVKSEVAGLTAAEIAAKNAKKEKDRVANLSIDAFERGLKKRRKKKESKDAEEPAVKAKGMK